MAKKHFKKRNNRDSSKGFGKRPANDASWSDIVRENANWETDYK